MRYKYILTLILVIFINCNAKPSTENKNLKTLLQKTKTMFIKKFENIKTTVNKINYIESCKIISILYLSIYISSLIFHDLLENYGINIKILIDAMRAGMFPEIKRNLFGKIIGKYPIITKSILTSAIMFLFNNGKMI